MQLKVFRICLHEFLQLGKLKTVQKDQKSWSKVINLSNERKKYDWLIILEKYDNSGTNITDCYLKKFFKSYFSYFIFPFILFLWNPSFLCMTQDFHCIRSRFLPNQKLITYIHIHSFSKMATNSWIWVDESS